MKITILETCKRKLCMQVKISEFMGLWDSGLLVCMGWTLAFQPHFFPPSLKPKG